MRLVLFISGILSDAMVGIRLTFYNSLFRNISSLDLHRLKCVPNSLARIANTTMYSHITPVKRLSLGAYQALLCLQDGSFGVQVYTWSLSKIL